MKRLILGLVAVAIWLIANPVIAQEYQPYPSPKIAPEQWAKYVEEVRQLHAESLEIYEDKQLFAFSDMHTRTFWIFTMKHHPAHPAWITRQMYEEGGVVRIRQIGYFAGSEEEFAKLFREYQDRNEQLKEEVERQNQ